MIEHKSTKRTVYLSNDSTDYYGFKKIQYLEFRHGHLKSGISKISNDVILEENKSYEKF